MGVDIRDGDDMPDLIEMIDKVIEDKLDAADKFIESFIEPIADVGSPVDVVGKPYEQWEEQDLMRLSQVFDKEKLERFIFNKEYAKLQKLESGVGV